jgi:hypothetical protein
MPGVKTPSFPSAACISILFLIAIYLSGLSAKFRLNLAFLLPKKLLYYRFIELSQTQDTVFSEIPTWYFLMLIELAQDAPDGG